VSQPTPEFPERGAKPTALMIVLLYGNCPSGGVPMSAFNWSAIDWVSLVALSLLVLVAARVGERLSFGSRGLGALVTTLLFAIGFAAWSYGLHDTVRQAIAMIMPTAPPG
jgi:hypothetical protein